MFQVIATGRLTRDSSQNFTADGTPVLGFSVATDVGYKDNKHPVYLGCSLWGKRAESLHPYLKKGMSVTIIGKADLRLWEKGEKHGAEITVNVDDVVMQGGKADSDDKPKQEGFRSNAPAMAGKVKDDFDDGDIPF